MSFLVGAVVGLLSGLAFGGGGGKTVRLNNSAQESVSTTSPSTGQADTTPSEPMTAERARAIGANEMGQVLVLEYHAIATEDDLADSSEADDARSPEDFRKDIALLKAEGFYPVNVRDLASGNIDIPAGKSPVVVVFVDSSPGQYRILDDGTVDPNSAVGIMEDAVTKGNWASRASFYCLIDVVPKEHELFGQADRRQEKLRNLVEWGYEIGSHTLTHLNLKKAARAEAVRQLAESQRILEDLVGGDYSVTSLSVPFGEYPEDVTLLKRGEYEGAAYSYTAAVTEGDLPSASPFSTKFDPLRIPSIAVTGGHVSEAVKKLKERPDLRYISDGDPMNVSVPAELAAELGDLKTDLGRPVIRY